ncbi:hybrid sensor histidine kinase/response regulator [Simiduia agarivorans]|uniref:histidine kinase n=1 Tax=Simiduia agarivorans (strain DSM 21679 / JCM 13881 / BCRC 17597 / SA1) TaxID=1117647 RepID=K4L293_SIMAS|nr:hybrid sensor histidine kinase/response regulator [Simiduia agarivorans]AFV00298.1 integral membrane sensor hybrid histidine kinase [Simiduia agarivorans SA1 = DSM 21679]
MATRNTLDGELLQLLANQSGISIYPMSLALGAVAYFASDNLPTWVWISWLLVSLGALQFRSYLVRILPDLVRYSERRRLQWVMACTCINGIVHALPLVLIDTFSSLERAIVTMLLIGASAISVTTTAGYRPIALSYSVPALGTAAMTWLVCAWIHPDSRAPAITIAGMLMLYFPMLLYVSGNSFRVFARSFRERVAQTAVNTQLQLILEQAETASSAKTRFLASASHDLRQPIHALTLFCAALARKKLDSDAAEIVQHMDAALSGLASQLDSLLDISKLDAGVVDINRQTFNLLDMAERLQVEFSPAAEQKGLSIWLDCYLDVYVDTDPGLFERILRNLLSNAIKYTEQGRILISINAEDDQATVSIVDTGRGIPRNEQRRVFEEFYQLENPERDRRKGLGLGLAIVKRLVKLLDLRFSLYSVPDDGTRISLCLPISQNAPSQHVSRARPITDWSDMRILVVDDEMEVRLGMQALLQTLGATVDLADSTQEALTLALANKPSVLLADWRLRSDDNGIDTIRTLRGIYPTLPALLISGDTAPDRLREANAAGITLLHKPVAANQLEEAVAAACNLQKQLIPAE